MSEENQVVPEAAPTEEAVVETSVTEAPVVTNETDAETIVQDAETTTETPQKEVSQEEFNKLYFQLKQAERERDAAKATTTTDTTVAPVAVDNTVPTLEQFEFDEDKFNAANIQYQVKTQVDAALQAQTHATTATQEADAKKVIADAFNARAVDYAASNPEYNKAIDAAGSNATFSPTINEVILNSEVGPQIDHKLLTDPQLVAKLNAMAPVQAIMEMGRMEDAIKVAPKPAAQVSNAPEPIDTTNSGGGRVTNSAPNDEMTMEEYYAASQAEKKANLAK